MRLNTLKMAGGLIGLLAISSGAVAQETNDWAGFYGQVFGGYALDADRSQSGSIGPANLTIGGTVVNGTQESSNGRINGVFGGLGAGYNYQHNNLVLGLESNVGVGGLGQSNTSNLALSLTNGADTASGSYQESTDYDINWYTSLVGSVGVAHGNWLFSLKGGVVLADASINASSRLIANDPNGLLLGTPLSVDIPGSSSTAQVLIGSTFGFGAETMIADNVSLGAEYSYVSLPDLSVNSPGAGALLGGLFGGGSGSTFGGGIHEIKASLKYHF